MMGKSRIKLAVKFTVFVLVTCFFVNMVNEWLKPKYYYNQTWPATNTFLDFYKLKKNSVDVLFFGSSHAVCSFNPQVLYDTYGITSYNLGSEQQSMVVSYFWLQEALKYQQPKVVVLDTYMLHKFGAVFVYNEMNCSEGAVRKAMDCMRPSLTKWQDVKEIARIDPTQNALSYFLPNLRYHTRWTELGEDDFTESAMIDHGGIKGFTVLGGGVDESQTYTPFTEADAATAEADAMVGSAAEYLDKIVSLCSEKGIDLILTNIPCAEPIGRYASTKQYADAHGVPYYDFNEETYYYAINYDPTRDLLSHPSYFGAEKITNFFGQLLTETYVIAPREDASFIKSGENYQHQLKNIQLQYASDSVQLLDLLQDDTYTLFVFAPTSYSSYLSDDVMNCLFALGFTTELRDMPDGWHYCAVKDGNQITEKITDQDFSFSGPFRDGFSHYSFCVDTTLMIPESQTYSLKIDGAEYGCRADGIQIVVYDRDLKTVVTKVTLNTNNEEATMTHN